MNNVVSIKNNRLFAWLLIGLLTIVAICSPWVTSIAFACQGHGGGC